MTAAHRVSEGGSFRFDRRFRGVGRIARASGAKNERMFARLNDMLTELHEDGYIDILRAIRSNDLTAQEVYEARRKGKLSRVAADVVLFRGLWDAIDAFLEEVDVSPGTRRRYRASLEGLARHRVLRRNAKVRDLATVNWGKVRRAWPNSPADWNRMRSAVGRFLTVLLGDVYHSFRRRVMNAIPRASEPEGRVPDLSVALFWQIVEASPEDVRPVWITLAATGLRIDSEFVKLREEHLMPHTHSIRVPGTKTASSRSVIRVGPEAWRYVVAAVPSRYAYSTLHSKFKKVVRALGCGDLTLHDLRHFKGIMLANAGVPEAVIQDALRLRTPRMTRRYTRQREQGRAGEATDRTMFGKEESA